MELNGFKIDKFNQYGLDTKAKSSTCPLCSHTRKKNKDKCLSLWWESGLGNCAHCGETVQLHTYHKRSNEKQYIRPEWKNKTELSEKLVKWFNGRGISQETLLKMKITEGVEFMPQQNKQVNTIQFNYFINDELINVKYRDGAKNFKLFKGGEKVFYNLDGLLGSDEVIIVEGEMDVLSFVEVGINHVVSVPNGATMNKINLDYLDNCIDFFESKSRILIATDQDEPGQNLKNELVRRLGSERCYIVDFEECKDANEYLLKHGKDKLCDRVTIAEAVPLENTITVKDQLEELHDFYINGAKQGFQIGIESWDKIFSTYTGNVVTVTGRPGSGKSDFVDMMAVGYNLGYNWKIGFASPENKPDYLHMDKICRKFFGRYPKENELNSKEWMEIIDHVNDNFFHMDFESSYDLESILKKAKEYVTRKGIKMLVIDPYNKCRLKSSLNKSINDYTNDYYSMLDEYAKKLDILIVVVAHPVKMRKAPGETEMPKPDMYDIKGGGEIYDMSHHGILVHRNYQFNLVEVKVLKIKFHHLGKNFESAYLSWCPANGRYGDINGIPEDHSVVFDKGNWLRKENEYEADPDIWRADGGFTDIENIPF